ncbi:MAG: hypothetical protein ACYC0F_03515 [Rhodanobacter sp.]
MTATEKAALDLQEKLNRLLAKTKPSKREQVMKNFRNLFPRLQEHICQGKPVKEVLAAFNALNQSNFCLRTFNDLLNKERERRRKDGASVRCHACGQPLEITGATDSTFTDSNTSDTDVSLSNPSEQE